MAIMMVWFKASVVICISVLSTSYARFVDIYERSDSLENGDPWYRPWKKNGTSAAWVSLEGMDLPTFDTSFRLHLNELPQWLVLDGNHIRKLSPEAFENWGVNLTYVSLARNRLTEIGTGILRYLKKLQVLDLDENPVKESEAVDIPCSSSTLERLYLRNCGLPGFHLRSCTNRLTHLRLSDNGIRVFYTESDSSLTHLYLERNSVMHITLSQLDRLVYLNLDNNQLNGIASISNGNPVTQATYFRMYSYQSYNEIKSLYLDGAVSLRYLVLSSNEITKIQSNTFVNVDKLVSVNLNDNEISQVDPAAFANLVNLEEVLLNGNRIERIRPGTFVNLPKLRLVSLKDNQIEKVDGGAFAQLNSVANNVTLFLDNNKIHTLERGSFRGIKGLRQIGLSGNKIKAISSEAFVGFPYLESIIIEEQSVDQSAIGDSRQLRGLIESRAFFNLSSLISITIRGNSFAEIKPQAFHDLPQLLRLDLSNNSVRDVSPQAFGNLPKIEELNLEANELLKIGEGVFPKRLKRLNLAWNSPREDFNSLNILDLRQLEELDVSGIIGSFKANELSAYSRNLTITVRRKNA